MKRSQKYSSRNQSIIKKPKLTPIMGQIVTNPGLQHIIEIIFLNLDFEDLQGCQLVNKSCKKILENPRFWLKKWRFNTSWIKRLSLFGVNWKSDISIIHIRNNDYIQEDHKNQIDLIFQLFVYILQQFKLNLTKIQVL